MGFQHKQSVEWTSQANGKMTQKKGTVEVVVPPGQKAKMLAEAVGLAQTHIVETDWTAPGTRSHESYLVSVPAKGNRGKPHLYWPRVSALRAVGSPASAGASPASPSVSATASTSPPVSGPAPGQVAVQITPHPPLLRNHMAFLIDTSVSMRDDNKIAAAQKALESNVAAIREESAKSHQYSTVSLGSFDNSGSFTLQVNGLPTHADIRVPAYSANGSSTALYESTARLIDHLLSLPEANDENTSLVGSVFTDGEENSSKGAYASAYALRQKIAEFLRTGRGTLTFLVPPGRFKQALVDRLGVSPDNILEWTQSAKGLEQAARSHVQGVQQFYADRAKGKKSTDKFYVDLSKVSDRDLEKQLVDVSAHFKSWQVPKSGLEISQFIEEKTKRPYIPGSAYYPLLRPEYLLKGRAVLLQKFGEETIYGGPAVRKLLGIPEDAEKVRIEPKNLAGYTVLVQSGSVNRHLVSGTRVYLDQSFQGGMTPTWVPPVVTSASP